MVAMRKFSLRIFVPIISKTTDECMEGYFLEGYFLAYYIKQKILDKQET